MEDRRPIHYSRNSVIVPKLGNKSQHRLFKKPLDMPEVELKIPQNTDPKICSTLQCPRCNAEQDCYRVTCRVCRACFYCGLVGGGKWQCHFCGNHIPPEDREKKTPETIRIG